MTNEKRNHKPRKRHVRTIGTSVGQMIREAQAASESAERAQRAAILRKMAGKR